MSEDVSGMTRLAITVCLLAALISSVLTIFIIMSTFMNDYSYNFINAVNNTGNTAISDISKQRYVGAPTAYRVLSMYEGSLDSVSIRFADGTTTSDLDVLLRYASVNVTVSVTADNLGMYDVVVVEVTE